MNPRSTAATAQPKTGAAQRPDEADRLAALARYDILDTPRERDFDDIAELAAEICETPVALVSLVADGRQWFKAEVGMGTDETSREISFCAHALFEEDILLVPDATRDPRFANNPLVTGAPGFGFYAGALLKTEEQFPLGTLCVLDYRPRELSERQVRALRRLARQAMAQLELRRALRAQAATNARLETIMNAATDYAILTTDPQGVITTWSAGAEAVFGWTVAEAVGQSASMIFTNEDRLLGVDARELATAAQQGSAPDERWHVRRDGGRVFMNGSVQRLPAVPPVQSPGFLKIARDETERRTQAEALRAERDRLRGVLEGMAEGYVLFDSAFTITDINDTGVRLDGRRREDMVGRNVWDVWPASIGSPFEIAYRRAMAERVPVAVEHRFMNPEAGSDLWVEVRAFPTRDGGVAGFYRDVTDRKRAEASLRAEGEAHAALIAAQQDVARAAGDVDAALGAVVEGALGASAAADGAAIELVDGDDLVYRAVAGRATPFRDLRVGRRGSLSGLCVAEARPLVCRDSEDDPRVDRNACRQIGLRSMVVVPVFRRGEAVGVLKLQSGRPDAFTDRDVAVAQLLVGALAAGFADAAEVAAGRALRDSEARLRLALEGGGLGTWRWDAAARLVEVSERVAAILGVPSGPAIAAPVFEAMFHPDDAASVRDAVARSIGPQDAPFDVEYRAVRPADGALVWVAAKGKAQRDGDGRVVGLVGTVQDTTERKRTEEALAASERRLQAIFDSVPVGIVFAEAPSGRILSGNAQVERIFGHPILPSADIAQHGEWSGFHPDGRPVAGHEYPLARALRGEAERPEMEVLYRRGDGRHAWVRLMAVPIRDDVGRIVGGVVACLDVDREKRAEASLRQLNETLEGRVTEEVAQRARVEDALRQSQKMEAIGQLTGGVAHDFNNMLTIIKSSTDLLRRPDLAPERRRRYVDAISDTVERAARLTGQLLAFARRQALKPEVFDVAARIRAVTEMLGTIVGARIAIAVETTDVPCLVEADASQFETALVNIAVNARDAMEGEGRLTVRVVGVPAIPSLRGHAGAVGAFVAVSMTDTGSGIPPDRIEHIFEPFFTTKEVGKGTGLGLSQVFGFTKQSGGDIAVESEEGRGTTFTLYLPRIDRQVVADVERAPDTGRHRAEDGRGRRVLVVEDNVDVGTFSTQVLGDLGYETTLAADAGAALALLAAGGRFDVVFSDVVMPGMGGVELGREIRRLYPSLPVVLTSGYSHVLAQEGTHGFELLHKPYAVEDLSKVLRRATRRRVRAGADGG